MLRRARSVTGPQRLVDYQLLAMVAVAMAILTRGAVLPVLAMTAVVAIVSVGYEVGARRYRRRYAGSTDSAATDSAPPTKAELTDWVKTVERLLHSPD